MGGLTCILSVFRNECNKFNNAGARVLDRVSYISAYALLNLVNELRKRDKMRGLPSILSLFRNEANKFNNTGARMLDSF